MGSELGTVEGKEKRRTSEGGILRGRSSEEGFGELEDLEEEVGGLGGEKEGVGLERRLGCC